MPLEHYPPLIAHADFGDLGKVARRRLPTPRHPFAFSRARTDQQRGIIPVFLPARAQTEVWIQAQHAGSVSYSVPHVGAVDIPFAIAPFHEAGMEIRWKFRDPNGLRKARLQLFCAGERKSVWTTTWKRNTGWRGQEGQLPQLFANAVAGPGGHDGAMGWDGTIVVPTKRVADFPDGCVTACHSPYKLLMSTEDAHGNIDAAWTYFHVKVRGLKIFWGTPADVPAAPTVDPIARQAEVHAAEHGILNGLPVMQGSREVDPAPAHDIVLPSNAFCYNLASLNLSDGPSKMYRSLWQKGPRLPLRAVAEVVNSGGHPVVEGRALGPLRVMWDWTSEPERGPGGRAAAMPHAQTVQAFLDDALDYRLGMENDSPHESDNAHVDYGGKRGQGGEPVFLSCDGNGPFPYRTHDCTERPWARMSSFVRTPGQPGDATSGVIFNPSPIAGDSYKIVAYLAYQRRDGKRPYLDQRISHTVLQAELAAAPQGRALPSASTQFFTVRRQTTLSHYVTMSGLPVNNFAVASIVPFFSRAFMDIQTPGQPTAVIRALYEARLTAQTVWFGQYTRDAALLQLALPAPGVNVPAPAPLAGCAITFQPWNAQLMGQNNAGVANAADYQEFCKRVSGEIVRPLLREYRLQNIPARGVVLYHFDELDNLGSYGGAAVTTYGDVPDVSTDRGTAHISFGANWAGKPLDSLATHELGHTFGLQHAVTHIANGPSPGGARPGLHDAGHSCVMNYDAAGRQFCAMCLLGLRGWRVSSLGNAAGGNRRD